MQQSNDNAPNAALVQIMHPPQQYVFFIGFSLFWSHIIVRNVFVVIDPSAKTSQTLFSNDRSETQKHVLVSSLVASAEALHWFNRQVW